MASTASRNSDTNETRTFNDCTTSMAPNNFLKRKREDAIDLTEDEDLNSCTGEKNLRATAGAQHKGSDDAFDKAIPFARVDVSHASDVPRPRKEKSSKAQNVQMDQVLVEEQLLFECGTCCKEFEDIAELNDHNNNIKHNEQPPVRCRKCRKTFTNITERDHHFQTSSRHFCCRYCGHVVEFSNAKSLRYHYIDHHILLYCHFCNRHFSNTFQRLNHMERRHRSCSTCCKMFPVPELCNGHCRACFSAKVPEGCPKPAKRDGVGEGFPDHYYAKLGIGASSSHEQVRRAAKEMRIKTHPDRLKRQEGLTDEEKRAIDKEAALVGQAAEILSDPGLREMYDCKMHGW